MSELHPDDPARFLQNAEHAPTGHRIIDAHVHLFPPG